LDFFSTRCSDSCSKMAINMRNMEKAFAKDPKKENTLNADVQFISISLDPQKDSFPALRVYADKYKADHDHWWLLTGDKAQIYNYVRNELNVNLPMDADSIGRTTQWIALDKDRYIRGYYNGQDIAGLKHCADDVVFISGENGQTQKK
jgi:protein SCO1